MREEERNQLDLLMCLQATLVERSDCETVYLSS